MGRAWCERNAHRVLVGKSERERSLGGPRRRWKDNIGMGLQEVEWGTWTVFFFLAQDKDRWRAVVNKVMNLRVLLVAGNFLTSWKTVSFSRRTLLRGVSF
jgi:hypothetical protein